MYFNFVHLSLLFYNVQIRRAEYENRRRIDQLNMAEQRLQELRSMYDSLHSLRHDLKNHLHIAAELARVGRISGSADYLQKIDACIFSVFSTGCISLDSVLTVKELQMRQSGICFEHQLCALGETPIEDTELSTIVMNLLDNAIEEILWHASPPENPLSPSASSARARCCSSNAAIPWTQRRSAGAANAFSPPSPEEGMESACRASTTS